MNRRQLSPSDEARLARQAAVAALVALRSRLQEAGVEKVAAGPRLWAHPARTTRGQAARVTGTTWARRL